MSKKRGKKHRTPAFYKAFFVLLTLILFSAVIYAGIKYASANRKNSETKMNSTETVTQEPTSEAAETVITEPVTEGKTETTAAEVEEPSAEVSERDFIDRMVTVALTEDRQPVHNGKTKYGELFGAPYAAWCTEFVMYCIRTAEDELDTDYIGTMYPWSDYSGGVMEWYKARDRFREADGDYIPQKGDIIIFDTYKSGESDHTGLCVGTVIEDGQTRVITVEGNIPTDTEKVIRNRNLAVDEDIIVGYCIALTDEAR